MYAPVINMVHQYKIMKHFKKLTITDLYIWIIRHWNYLRERYHVDIKSEDAAINLKEKYSENLIYRYYKGIKNIFKKTKKKK